MLAHGYNYTQIKLQNNLLNNDYIIANLNDVTLYKGKSLLNNRQYEKATTVQSYRVNRLVFLIFTMVNMSY